MTTASQAAARIQQALRPIDDSGQSHGGPDGWSPTAEEIQEWQDYFHECASPEALRALLAERDELAKDAGRWRLVAGHWKDASMRWKKEPNVPKSITITVDFGVVAAEAAQIEGFLDMAARAALTTKD